jgi:hypothetical protein
LRQALKQATHKNRTCTFYPEDHRYAVDNADHSPTSATAHIDIFFPAFDADAIAEKTSERRGIPAEALKLQWEKMGRDAARRGDIVHRFADRYLQGKINLSSGRKLSRILQQTKNVCDLLLSRYEYLESEKLIFSAELMLAGTVDLLMKNRRSEVLILDWKTAKAIKFVNPWQSGFSPISHLEDCNYNHYALQLSLYQYIMEQEQYFPKFTQFKRLILHVGDSFCKAYAVRYMKEEVSELAHIPF